MGIEDRLRKEIDARGDDWFDDIFSSEADYSDLSGETSHEPGRTAEFVLRKKELLQANKERLRAREEREWKQQEKRRAIDIENAPIRKKILEMRENPDLMLYDKIKNRTYVSDEAVNEVRRLENIYGEQSADDLSKLYKKKQAMEVSELAADSKYIAKPGTPEAKIQAIEMLREQKEWDFTDTPVKSLGEGQRRAFSDVKIYSPFVIKRQASSICGCPVWEHLADTDLERQVNNSEMLTRSGMDSPSSTLIRTGAEDVLVQPRIMTLDDAVEAKVVKQGDAHKIESDLKDDLHAKKMAMHDLKPDNISYDPKTGKAGIFDTALIGSETHRQEFFDVDEGGVTPHDVDERYTQLHKEQDEVLDKEHKEAVKEAKKRKITSKKGEARLAALKAKEYDYPYYRMKEMAFQTAEERKRLHDPRELAAFDRWKKEEPDVYNAMQADMKKAKKLGNIPQIKQNVPQIEDFNERFRMNAGQLKAGMIPAERKKLRDAKERIMRLSPKDRPSGWSFSDANKRLNAIAKMNETRDVGNAIDDFYKDFPEKEIPSIEGSPKDMSKLKIEKVIDEQFKEMRESHNRLFFEDHPRWSKEIDDRIAVMHELDDIKKLSSAGKMRSALAKFAKKFPRKLASPISMGAAVVGLGAGLLGHPSTAQAANTLSDVTDPLGWGIGKLIEAGLDKTDVDEEIGEWLSDLYKKMEKKADTPEERKEARKNFKRIQQLTKGK